MLRKNGQNIIAIVFWLSFMTGCGSVESLHKKYPGYTVVEKKIEKQIIVVPNRIVYCLTLDNREICKRRYGAGELSCQMKCVDLMKKGLAKEIKVVEGTKEKLFFDYILRLRSPAGEDINHKTRKNIFNQIKKGQVFPDRTTESK